MTHTADDTMLDLVYEAAYDPSLWVKVMESLADRIGATSGAMTQFDMRDGAGEIILSRLDPGALTSYFAHFAKINVLSNVADATAYFEGWRPMILTDQDWMPKDELVRSEYYNDFLAPQDIHSTVMIRLAAHDTNVSAISLNRSLAVDQFSLVDLDYAYWLHPHLIRSYELGRKIAASRRVTSDLGQALEHSEHGIFLVEGSGRIRHANRVGQDLLTQGDTFRSVGGHLSVTNADAAGQLLQLIGLATAASGEGRRGGSLAATSPNRHLPFSVTVAPLRADRVLVFENQPCALVCVTDLEGGISPPEQKLRTLFGLTGAEARVALALFEGMTPKEAACALGVSFNTVRTQLARIFEKTGTNRQAELIRLMMRTVATGL